MWWKILGETCVEFEAIIETDDKIGKNVDDMEIDELDDPDVQYQEIDTDNEGESKAEDDIRDDTNIWVTEDEEVGEGNLQEAQIEKNELKESAKQKIVKDINVKTTSKILSSLHKGMLIGSKKAIYACKLAKRELKPFLNYTFPKQYTYDSSKARTH